MKRLSNVMCVRGVRSSHMYYKAGERESPESWTGNWRIESLKVLFCIYVDINNNTKIMKMYQTNSTYINAAGPQPSSYFEHKKLSGKDINKLNLGASYWPDYEIVFQGYPFGRFDWQMGKEFADKSEWILWISIQGQGRVCAARSRLHLPTLSYLSPSHLALKRHSPVTGGSHPTLKCL